MCTQPGGGCACDSVVGFEIIAAFSCPPISPKRLPFNHRGQKPLVTAVECWGRLLKFYASTDSTFKKKKKNQIIFAFLISSFWVLDIYVFLVFFSAGRELFRPSRGE